jgi:hypothetical protein
MPSLCSPLKRIARLLAEHVRRLRESLVTLTAQVRAAVARIVGQATGNAVRDALTVILDGPPAARLTSARDPPDEPGFWPEQRRPYWHPQRRDDYDPYEEGDRFEDEDDDAAEEETTSDEPKISTWARAVGIGCQAAGWFLRRHPGRGAVIAALGVGIVAGLAAVIGSPFVCATSAVLASALGVLSLAEAASSAATLACAAVT